MDSIARAQVASAFEALLLVPVLRRAFAGADALGDFGVDLLAREIASKGDGRFAQLVAGEMERRP